MDQINLVLRNENLFDEITSFLSFSDIKNLSSTNKLSKKYSNKKWENICKNSFSSVNEDYSIIGVKEDDNNNRDVSLMNENNSINSQMNWKEFYICGEQLKYLWQKISSEQILSLNNDCILLQNKLFSTLKGILFLLSNLLEFWQLPNLRKSNPIVENDLNTPHQTFLYDYLYEEQSINNYYNIQIREEKKIVKCRKQNDLFADTLINLDKFNELNENEADFFENLKFYDIKIEG